MRSHPNRPKRLLQASLSVAMVLALSPWTGATLAFAEEGSQDASQSDVAVAADASSSAAATATASSAADDTAAVDIEQSATAFTIQFFTVDANGTASLQGTKPGSGNPGDSIDYASFAAGQKYPGFTYDPSLSKWTCAEFAQLGITDYVPCEQDPAAVAPFIMDSGSSTVNLYYVENAPADYEVQYIRIASDGTTTTESVTGTGPSGSYIDDAAYAAAKSYPGYTYDSSKSAWTCGAFIATSAPDVPISLNKATIIDDGTMVLKLYYTQPAQTTATFKVLYYKVDANGNKSVVDTADGTGNIGDYVDYASYAKAKTYDGYAFDDSQSAWTYSGFIAYGEPDCAISLNGAMIAEDDSTVVKLYYVESKTPATSTSKTASVMPKTGDSSPFGLTICLLMAGVIVTLCAAFIRRSENLSGKRLASDSARRSRR